jgi:hypothetical protein
MKYLYRVGSGRGLLFVFVTSCAAQAGPPREIAFPEIYSQLKVVREIMSPGISPSYDVEGAKQIYEQAIVADTITFKPGSSLVFQTGSKISNFSQTSPGNARYIIARRLVLPNSASTSLRTPTITWDRRTDEFPEPPPVGTAQGGDVPQLPGANGGPGANGAQGNPGIPGRNAPVVFLFVGSIEGGPITVNLRGENGGPGGKGQMGGQGAPGRKGTSAVLGIVDCRAGGGNGGDGGRGGDGGPGGPPGPGGAGGAFVIVSVEETLSTATQAFSADVNSGKPGRIGAGGAAGKGGGPGDGGDGGGQCGGGRPGNSLGDGQPGKPGPTIADDNKNAGSYAISRLTREQLSSIFPSP